ncbi:predicted protein [Naegleria gruberi]|uniref:Predicted protein n=1 Tax=Naegleria gruberi TaxID=5762 RepID=D2VFL5_NAEGR|nr:uncharacterized protein NAEGRDRAFT_49137 [Naegleria gruberi]EFC44380.1 predicted protein [Naegleria gruberi]|eukprot:XP_002677124.1 predicted protein [Naegleria gruberi strain NEG-M]
MNAVKVLHLKGKLTANMGFSVRRENLCPRLDQYPSVYIEGLDLKIISRQDGERAFKFLHIEEALYLIDVGTLILIHEKDPMDIKTIEVDSKSYNVRCGNVISTVQEAYSLFLRYSNQLNSLYKYPEDLLNSFIAYSYLKKLGFSVQRHSIDHIIKDEKESKKRKVENNTPIETKQTKSQSKRKKKERKACDFPNTYPYTMTNQESIDVLSDESNKPLVYNMKLEDSQELNLQQLFNTLNIVQHEKFNSNVNNETERIMFDVWKSGTTDLKSPPAMVVIITSFSRSTVPPIEDVFRMHNMFGTIPIFYCMVGDSGSILFMNIAPFEIENLNMPSQNSIANDNNQQEQALNSLIV